MTTSESLKHCGSPGGRWASSDIYQDQAQGWKVTLHTEKTEYRKTRPGTRSTVHAFEGTKDFTLPVSKVKHSHRALDTEVKCWFVSIFFLLVSLPIKELMEKLGMYLVSFDRSEYGEGDPNPKRDVKSKELDIKKMADQLDLGQKLYVLGSGWEDTLFGDASSIYLTGKHIDTTKYMLMKYATQNSDFRVKLYMLH